MALSPAQKRIHQAALRLFAETGSSDLNVSELAARGLGLDRGPMYGFDNAKVDAEFFGCGKELHSDERELFTAGYLRSNFLCKLGYGDRSKLYRRQPRLDFDEACQLV